MKTDESPPKWINAELSEQLLSLCERGEGINLEFKRELPTQFRDIAKTIAAFASSSGGQILVGVGDDGTICGLTEANDPKNRDTFVQRIVGIARDVKPSIQVDVRWAIQSKAIVAIVGVEKGIEPIYYADNKPYVRRGNISRPAEPDEVGQTFRERYSIASMQKSLPSTLEISERLKHVLTLINQQNYDALTVVDLAQAMGLNSPAELESVFEARTAPAFALIDSFAARFAVNKAWLLTGRSAPFQSTVPYEGRPEQYYDQIEKAKPEVVYLVRSTSKVGECCIVIQRDEMTAWLLPDVWHVSNHVGGGGSRDLLGLYYLFKRWMNREDRPFNVLGRQIEPTQMTKLYNGELFPGIVNRGGLSHWWDDLTDIEHAWTNRTSLLKTYGASFVAAQDIIREMLKGDNSL